VISLPVSESAEGFTLHGSVNPNGAATTYHFDFGITEAYGQSFPSTEASVGSGSTPVAVAQLVKGLPPEVPYHYRVVAHNAGGTSFGEDQFFMTPATPESSPAMTKPSTAALVPSAPIPPSNSFSVRVGTASAGKPALAVQVAGPGSIAVSGKLIKAVRVNAAAASAVSLPLKLTSAGRKALGRSRRHRLSVKLTIVFQPLGGSAAMIHRAAVFKQ